MRLNILSAGAAQGVVDALTASFEAQSGSKVSGTFGAVGVMKEKLLGGASADLVILTQTQIAELVAAGRLQANSCGDLGRVRTGIAVKDGEAAPDVSSAAALRAAMLGATAIYLPDPLRATAGIHFAKVLEALGVRAALEGRLHPHPNGAAAMREMARAQGGGQIGCTQITEINNTPGVRLVAPLPREFELATTYSVAVCADAANPAAARQLAALLTGESSRALRVKAGFEV